MKYFVERTFIKDLKTLPKEVKEAVNEYFNSVEKATAFNEPIRQLNKTNRTQNLLSL